MTHTPGACPPPGTSAGRSRPSCGLPSRACWPGGHCYLICFSDRQPGTCGPRRVSQDELRAAFSDGWAIASIEAESFSLNQERFGVPAAQAWLAVIERRA